MPNRSTVITVLALLGVAFLWGYKQETLFAALQSSPPAVTPRAAVDEAAPVNPASTQPVLGLPAAKIPGAALPAQPIAGAQPPGAVRPNSLSNTLDSIRPGQVPQEQVTQRNAYFEKLSQQLKELQGGTPPPPGEAAQQPPPQPNQPPPIEGQFPPGSQPPGAPPPPYPGSVPGFPGSAQQEMPLGAGYPANLPNPAIAPQADFDQATVGNDDEDDSDSDTDTDTADDSTADDQ